MNEVELGDRVRLRKPHPCGGDTWEVTRIGSDIRLRCLTCGRVILLRREQFRRRLRAVLPREGTAEK
ncbi:MAG: DUF951 domain-containing protein [Chloroflexia bacterium]